MHENLLCLRILAFVCDNLLMCGDNNLDLKLFIIQSAIYSH